MSEYKGIKGFQVQTRSEDPTPYAQALADMRDDNKIYITTELHGLFEFDINILNLLPHQL